MKYAQLTEPDWAATHSSMDENGARNRARNKLGARNAALLIVASVALAGCITVNAPEEAIVIELNINIKQEVIYRLAQDAGNTIEENADIF